MAVSSPQQCLSIESMRYFRDSGSGHLGAVMRPTTRTHPREHRDLTVVPPVQRCLKSEGEKSKCIAKESPRRVPVAWPRQGPARIGA
jgi:hypothetical protein